MAALEMVKRALILACILWLVTYANSASLELVAFMACAIVAALMQSHTLKRGAK